MRAARAFRVPPLNNVEEVMLPVTVLYKVARPSPNESHTHSSLFRTGDFSGDSRTIRAKHSLLPLLQSASISSLLTMSTENLPRGVSNSTCGGLPKYTSMQRVVFATSRDGAWLVVISVATSLISTHDCSGLATET